MEIAFYKLQCASNDILACDFSRKPEALALPLDTLAAQLCARRAGVGANGVIFLLSLEGGISLRYLSPEGRETRMSWDALVCLSRYVFDSGLVESSGFTVTINGEERRVDIIDSRSFRLCLGAPAFLGEDRPILLPVGGKRVSLSPIRLVEDGMVLAYNPAAPVRFPEFAQALRASVGPTKARPILIKANSRERVEAFSYGSFRASRKIAIDRVHDAACAAACAVRLGLCDADPAVTIGKSSFLVEWGLGASEIHVTGSAQYVYEGNYHFAESEGA